MSVIIKTIGGRQYAYAAYRIKEKVIHKYLGPVDKPEVKSRIKMLTMGKSIPEKYFNLFWDADPRTIDLKGHSRYIIERALEMGTLDVFFWLQRIYQTKLILETCQVSRRLSEKSRNFWTIWLEG